MWLFQNKSDFLKRMLIGIDYEIQRALVERSPMIYRRTNHQNRKKEGVATALYISYLGQEYILTVAHTFQDYDFNSLFIPVFLIRTAYAKWICCTSEILHCL